MNVQRPCVIDIGANIGDTALLLARFVPGTKVLCIEGNARFLPDLKRNTSQITEVTIEHVVLSDRNHQFQGSFVGNGGIAHIEMREDGDVMGARTLDDLLVSHSLFSHPDVIKIDTDGFEPAILRGATGVLNAARPVVFYEWDPYSYGLAGETEVGHANFLQQLGYDRFLIFTNTGELLLRIQTPPDEVWQSLAAFSRARRAIDGCHYDVAAFPKERDDVWGRLWCQYTRSLR